MKKILLGPSTFATVNSAPKDKLLRAGFEVVSNPFGRRLSKAELMELLPGVIGLIAGLEPLDREVLEKSDLKIISRCGSGLSNVDLEAAKELGIKVCSTPDAPVTAVAEVGIGALICLMRLLPQMNNAMHEHRWEKQISLQLEGKHVAIIGFGRIGQRVGELLRAFRACVVAVDPAYHGVVHDIPLVSFEEALKKADIITLHCSGNKTILGQREFQLMKKGVYLLNAARGELIDEEALIDALERKVLAGVWLDTFCQEPYSGRLCEYEQVILTPHIGSYTFECRCAMEMEAVDNLLTTLQKG